MRWRGPVAAGLAGLALAGGAGLSPRGGVAWAQPAPGAAPGRLHVLGRATLELPPDYASVQIGVATQAATAAGALAANATAARRALDIAKASGIAERDVATTAVGLAPSYRNGTGNTAPQPDGYVAQNSVTIRVRDIGRVGDLLRQVVETGANRIDGVGFGLDDPGRALEDAQAAAVTDALRRAGRMAAAAGVSLGPIDDMAAPPRRESQAGLPMAISPMMARKAQSAAVPVEAGTVAVSAEVDVTFRLIQP